jgi:hypothetical protein
VYENEIYVPENEIAVTAVENMGTYGWSTTLSPPVATGEWTPSPLDAMGMPEGDHFAWVEYAVAGGGTNKHFTFFHVVTDPNPDP